MSADRARSVNARLIVGGEVGRGLVLWRRFVIVTAAVFVLKVAGCSAEPPSPEEEPTTREVETPRRFVPFTRKMVEGYVYSLQSPTVVRSFSFGANGISVSTYGTVGGPVAGPAEYWSIDDDGALMIRGTPDGKGWRMFLIHLADDEVYVWTEGGTGPQFYRRSRR